jgi:hypothetical protein
VSAVGVMGAAHVDALSAVSRVRRAVVFIAVCEAASDRVFTSQNTKSVEKPATENRDQNVMYIQSRRSTSICLTIYSGPTRPMRRNEQQIIVPPFLHMRREWKSQGQSFEFTTSGGRCVPRKGTTPRARVMILNGIFRACELSLFRFLERLEGPRGATWLFVWYAYVIGSWAGTRLKGSAARISHHRLNPQTRTFSLSCVSKCSFLPVL